MRRTLTIISALLALMGCTPPPSHLERLGIAQLQPRLDAATARVPGVVFGAVWRDGSSLIRAAGKADLRTGRAMTDRTPLAWFSLTKLFTATAVLQLAEQGRIDLDAPVGKYLPEIQLRRDGRKATVRELLSHSAGVPNPVPEIVTWIHLAGERGPTIDEMIRQRLGAEPKLDFTPGTKTAYSNLGYLLLGKIVEQASGTHYETYVEKNVLGPLGCRASGFAVPADRATAYQRKWAFNSIAAHWLLDGRFFGDTMAGFEELRPFTVDGIPHGGLNGPVDCLLRFGRMMLRDGEGENGRVLSTESVRAMLTPTRLHDGKFASFGLAWSLGTIDGEKFADHEGGGGGYRAELRLYPHLGYAAAVLANETDFSTGGLARIILQNPHRQAKISID
jgi:CubicO group peptidase (beta-lactamase class C family)